MISPTKRTSRKAQKSEAAGRVASALAAVHSVSPSLGFIYGAACEPIPVISSGSRAVDRALGVGGFPRKRISEILGPESSGKTTLALHVVANAQREGGVAAYLDIEHALDPEYMKQLGVNLEELIVSQPDCAEELFEITEKLLDSDAVDVIVIDSVAMLVSKAELEGEFGEFGYPLVPRIMGQAMKKLASKIKKSNVVLIFINQLRDKPGQGGFGPTETTTGGRALKYAASVRVDIRRIGQIKEGEDKTANRTKVKVIKNKVAPPFKEAEFEIRYGFGIDAEAELIAEGLERKLIEGKGAWIGFAGASFNGKAAACTALREDPELRAKLMEILSFG